MVMGRDAKDELDKDIAWMMIKHPTWGFRRIARLLQKPEQKVRYRLKRLCENGGRR